MANSKTQTKCSQPKQNTSFGNSNILQIKLDNLNYLGQNKMKLVKMANLMRYWQDGGLTLQELSSLGPVVYKKGQTREIIFLF
jgi:hypothetical protein